MLAKLLSIGLKVAPKFKSWFFADGKFRFVKGCDRGNCPARRSSKNIKLSKNA